VVSPERSGKVQRQRRPPLEDAFAVTVMTHPGRISLLGIQITDCTSLELNAYICDVISSGRREAILNVNVHCMNLAWTRPWLRTFLNHTAVVFCDGDGVRLGARLAGKRIREKITYNRWMWEIAAVSAACGHRWYFVGGRPGVAEAAADRLIERFPSLQIVGCQSGYFDGQDDIERVVADVNRREPHILVLGMGMPVQEAWLATHLDRLRVNVALTGGAVFDYVSGRRRVTPDVFRRLKLEWLYRWLVEPRRLFRRYVIGNPLFLARVLVCEVLRLRRVTGRC
jgi:N-acetylglucosaminyldiphosphoundecaprenol N-acetyl-beta-D-mannosaminyltransferase